MKRTSNQMYRTDKYSQQNSVIRLVQLNDGVFIYAQSGCWFESLCSLFNFRYCAYLNQEHPWHSGNYRVLIHSEMRMWHDKNIQSNSQYKHVLTLQLNHLASLTKCLTFCLGTIWVWIRNRWSHFKFRYCISLEQAVPWRSNNYSVWIYSETCTWYAKNMQSNLP